MQVTPSTVAKFVELYEREFGEKLDFDAAEQLVRRLLDFYEAMYEWAYTRRQDAIRNGDVAP